jgi:hypothetical protein
MKQKDVVIGKRYLTYIGAELAMVEVVCERPPIPGCGYKYMRYGVGRVGNDGFKNLSNLPKSRSAAALRPLPLPNIGDILALIHLPFESFYG